jgi:hypothetical protein
MNLKTTYILFGVLLAVLIVFAVTQLVKYKPGDATKEQYVFADFQGKDAVKSDDIDAVRIERKPAGGKAEVLAFTRGKDGWQMQEPYPLRTAPYEVSSLVRQVAEARRESSEMSSNLAEYGLDDPREVVTLKKGDKEWKLNVGKDTGSGGVVYVSNAARPKEPTAVKRASLDAVFKKVNDFRDKALLTATAAATSRVALDAKGGTLALEKTGDGRWRFQKPPYGAAEFEGEPPTAALPVAKKVGGVRDLIDAAGGLRVETDDDFIAEGVSDADLAGKYGLEKGKPETLRVEATVAPPATGESRAEVLLIGKKAPPPEGKKDDTKGDTKKDDKKPEDKPEYYYARLENESAVVRVPAAKVKPLLDVAADPKPLRSRDLVNAGGFAKIDALDVQVGGTTVKLRQADDNKWKLYYNGARATDATAVHDLIDAVTGRKAVKDFVDKEDGLEFDKPAAVVSVWIDGIKKEEKKDEEKKEGEKAEEKKDDKEPALKSDKPTVKLTFGKRDRDKNVVYVRRESGDDKDKTVVTVSDAVLDKVTAGPLSYLDRKLATFSDNPFDVAKDVTKLTLQRGKETWEVTKEKAGDKTTWKITQPPALAGRTANDQSVTGVLQDLAVLRAEKFVAEKPSEKELADYGLKEPETKATVTVTKDGKWVYFFGKQSDTKMGVYAKQNKADLVFLVPALAAERVAKADFRDLTVFHFDMAKVKGAKITVWSNDLGGAIVLDLERKGVKDWVLKGGPAGFMPDGAVVESFIAGLAHLQASKFAAPKPNADTGLDVAKKALKVEITVEGEKEPFELLVGNEDPDNKDFFFASSNRLKGDTFLLPKFSFEKAKASPAFFRKS